jgi:hypothetical protein
MVRAATSVNRKKNVHKKDNKFIRFQADQFQRMNVSGSLLFS